MFDRAVGRILTILQNTQPIDCAIEYSAVPIQKHHLSGDIDLGWFNTTEGIDRAIDGVAQIAKHTRRTSVGRFEVLGKETHYRTIIILLPRNKIVFLSRVQPMVGRLVQLPPIIIYV